MDTLPQLLTAVALASLLWILFAIWAEIRRLASNLESMRLSDMRLPGKEEPLRIAVHHGQPHFGWFGKSTWFKIRNPSSPIAAISPATDHGVSGIVFHSPIALWLLVSVPLPTYRYRMYRAG